MEFPLTHHYRRKVIKSECFMVTQYGFVRSYGLLSRDFCVQNGTKISADQISAYAQLVTRSYCGETFHGFVGGTA